MTEKLKVKEYMTTNVITVSPGDRVSDVVTLIKRTEHDGFPVVENGKIKGYISSYELLFCDPDGRVGDVMSTYLLVAHPDMDLIDSARVIFRSGVSKLPVVDEDGNLVGIITNSDVIRSQIERADPRKVLRLIKTLEAIYNIKLDLKRGLVGIEGLIPTQSKIYADELEGRVYELKRGLAEPLVVVQMPNRQILVDGHHRVFAAKRLGIDSMDAYIIVMEEEVELGLERTAKNSGLNKLEDIEILDYAHRHPLVETTERLIKRQNDY
ncbi:MAG: CBS domain-containing protein [Halobacteriota archaeon]|nr:CBS domain-containing protein [Halobacteriota archaeon]